MENLRNSEFLNCQAGMQVFFFRNFYAKGLII